MKHIYKHLQLLVLLIGLVNYVEGKTIPNNNERKVINAHIEYYNLCTNYVNAVIVLTKSFNSKTNSYYILKNKENAKKYFKPFEIYFEGADTDYKLHPLALQDKHTQLIKSQEILGEDIRGELQTTLSAYQKEFDKFVNMVKSLQTFSENKELFFEDPKFTKTYESIHAIEDQVRVLTKQNDSLFNITQKLFGIEKLPFDLQKSKDIAFLSKKMRQQFRAEQKQELLLTIEDFEKTCAIRVTGDQSRALESYGDFGYLDNHNTQEKANIERETRTFIRIAKEYIEGKPVPCNYFELKKYNEYYCWVDRISSSYEASTTTIGRYNAYVKRAKVAVLFIVEEVKPFQLVLPEGKAPISIEREDLVSEIETQIVSNSQEKIDANNNTVKSIKKPVFNKDDLTTLKGSKANNLVLLLDVSSSMRLNDNETKLKKSINHLIDLLRPKDKLTIISYSGMPKKILETSTNYDKEALKIIINELKSEGNTNVKSALKMGYITSRQNYIKNGNNRIIIASDGGFKVDKSVKEQIQGQADNNVFLSTFHFVHKRSKGKEILSALSKIGKGSYQAITSEIDAVTFLVGESKQE